MLHIQLKTPSTPCQVGIGLTRICDSQAAAAYEAFIPTVSLNIEARCLGSVHQGARHR